MYGLGGEGGHVFSLSAICGRGGSAQSTSGDFGLDLTGGDRTSFGPVLFDEHGLDSVGDEAHMPIAPLTACSACPCSDFAFPKFERVG